MFCRRRCQINHLKVENILCVIDTTFFGRMHLRSRIFQTKLMLNFDWKKIKNDLGTPLWGKIDLLWYIAALDGFPPISGSRGTSVAIARENGQVWLWTSYFSHFKIRFRFRFFLRLPEICCQSKLQPIAFIVPAFNAVIFSNLNLLTGTFNLTIPSPAIDGTSLSIWLTRNLS